LWKTPRQEGVGWGTPIAIRAGGRDEIIVSSQRAVRAYNPNTGRELWYAEGNTREVIPTPAVGHGLVFCPSGRAGPTLAIRPGGSGDVTGTHIAWQSPRGSPFVPSPLVYGDYLYLVNDMTSVATCLEAKSGKEVWQGRLGEVRREGFSASPVAVDGKVFFTNDEGETFVLAAGPKFELLHVNRLGEPTLATPALVDGIWYFRTASHLLAIGR
jgi:outer membrane protein assembly factor BamB